MRAVVLAAGKGTRMKSALPKVLHPICGEPMLAHVLRALEEAGVGDVSVVVSPEVLDRLEELPGGAPRTVIQEPQLGTGHAVQVALADLPPADGPLLICSGDMPLVTGELLRRALDALRQAPASGALAGAACALVTARMPLPSSFGRIVRDGEGRVRAIVEARDAAPEQLAIDEMNAAIYAFDERLLRAALPKLSNRNAQGEYYLTDVVALAVAEGQSVIPVPCDDYRITLGINDRVELAAARRIMNARLCERWMREGVTIEDPETTYLEAGVALARDVTILHNTALRGSTRVGEGSTIGPDSELIDAIVGRSCAIRRSVVTQARLGDGVLVGPFAHLRPGADLSDGVHIGNYVEVKKSRLGKGTKANHLTYLGDAEIGSKVNIGAGTITCNYDGVQKHRTTIGDEAFIGTNSSLVAPIEIGAGALTGAGSVVIRNVAAGERVAGNPARPLPPKRT
ncbi:MAG TPA: bifunctional UDP-N-acetylglucosamine diphosphorylase/glucosamine-1-phosphate N-acetyltransferase GlmU [Candidatus Dormibacteraeota bacterium]|nr:bifunctional UDP-N-acetylglucosamine diphosphorylase/glucosamine-1-phosphate N-acetyltransferase GlmU [Candidatus Dormibacteraeota bacterium]